MKPRVLVGTVDGLHELGKSRISTMEGREFTHVTGGGSGLWALVDQSEVWSEGADGDWVRVASLEGLRANCLLDSGGALFVGTAEAHLYALRNGGLEPVSSFDSTPGHEGWHTPWGGPPDVRSMAPGPGSTVYANVHVGGIARSIDDGETWQPTIDIHADIHQVLYDPASALLLGASARGLAVSKDAGANWRYDTGGLHGRYLRAVAVSGVNVLVTASTGPWTDRGAVYRKPLESVGPFQRCEDGLPGWFSDNIDTFCLAGSRSWAAFGTAEGSVYSSSDAGQTWTNEAEGLPAVRCVALL
jgi:hypothetical protein